jgi:uncharacterized protein
MRLFHSLITSFVLSFVTLTTLGCATGGDDEYGEYEDEAAAPGSFDLYRSSDNQYRFRLNAGNGNILLQSEGYTTRTNAINGVLSVMSNGVDPNQYEVAVSKNNKHFLRLRSAANGQIIGFTQLYSSKSSAQRAVGSCVRAVTSYLDRVYTNTSRARVELSGDRGDVSFTVFDKAGNVVVTSHKYQTEASALNGAFAIQEGARLETSFKVVEADHGFIFTATALNNAVIATSPSFATREEAQAKLTAAKALLATLDIL